MRKRNAARVGELLKIAEPEEGKRQIKSIPWKTVMIGRCE